MSKTTIADRLIAKCNSWNDFSSGVKSLSKKQKGDFFERLTQLYLLTKPEYQTTLKNVWICQYGLPSRVRNKLNLPTTDEGIDLVAETRTGEFWAIQSKYRSDNAKPLTYKELSTFTNLTFNTCAGHFPQALVVHTSSKPVRKRKLLGNTIEIGLQRWLEMTPDDWGLIKKHLRKKPVRPKRRTPRPYQKKAISAAAKHFVKDKHSRGKLIMPCGTGKSLTAFWIAEELKAKTLLLVVPSLALIKQGVEDWTREIVARNETPLPEWLCVCSDETTGSVSQDGFVSETYDLGLPVTTDPKQIQQFLEKRSRKRRIVFVTYHSSPLVAKAARKTGTKFDLAILDEAHKTAGDKSKAFATMLFDKKLPIKNRIFMTATERVMRGAHDEVVSMDNANIYGDCFYHLSFKEAIHSDPAIISDYKILTLFVTEDEIKSVIKDRRLVTDRKVKINANDSRELAAAIALREAYKKYRIKHAVSFHSRISSAENFSKLHMKLNKVSSLRPAVECFHVSSKKPAGERENTLRDFAESKRSLIANARCLTEGVDVPAIDCVLFADPKQSTIDIVQAAGRALRPYDGKKFGYIMLPLIVPDGMTVDEVAESTEFRAVSRVLTELSTQDDRIAEEFRVVDRTKKKRDRIVQLEGTVPVGMNINFREFADAISAKLWERVAKVNWRPFEEAREYARGLNLTSQKEWFAFSKSGNRPEDIPWDPSAVYDHQGWSSMGDWLGTGRIASHLLVFRPFPAAREYACSLKLKSHKQWVKFSQSGKRPEDIPAAPHQHYEEWVSWPDFLGTGNIPNQNRKYRPFKEARKFARSLNLKSRTEWNAFTKSGKLPADIPRKPDRSYKDKGWAGVPNWLGKEPLPVFRPFPEARKYARSLKLKSSKEWREFTKSGKRPEDIPAAPDRHYEEWDSWPDFLETGNIPPHRRQYRPFKAARKYARSLKIKTGKEWYELSKSGHLPDDIPAYPDRRYKDQGWAGYGDWLGTGNIANFLRQYRPFKEARKYAQSLKLKSQKEWREFSRSGERPKDIPGSPETKYKDKGWIGYPDWLGTDNIATRDRKFQLYDKAKEFARHNKIISEREWRILCKSGQLPSDIPTNPNLAYRGNGWDSWGEFLGTGNIAPSKKKFQQFKSARNYAQSLKLKSQKEWFVFRKSGNKPDDIPWDPYTVYKDQGWISWPDWLGY